MGRGAAGFTVVELLITVGLLGLLTAASAPRVARTVTHGRVNQAAVVVSADVGRAFSLAQRLRRSVRIAFDPATVSYRLTDATGATVYETRRLQDDAFRVQTLSASQAVLVVGPNGLAAGMPAGGSLTVVVGNGDYARRVVVSRAGRVEIPAEGAP